MAVCHQPLAMILKYVYFDFYLFGQAVRVTTLFEFLLKIYEQNCGGFHDLVCHVATEVIEGLGYLHNQRIAHGQHFSQQPAPLLLVVTGGGGIWAHFSSKTNCL